MHTNTTGGPTDRPVLHRRPEDAADQPTTEPSEALRLGRIAWDARAAIISYQSDDPDDHPAADTETEVQWGVRYEVVDAVETTYKEKEARTWVGDGSGPLGPKTLLSRTVTYGPWREEA